MIDCGNIVNDYVDGIHLQMIERRDQKVLIVAGVSIPSTVVSSSKTFQNVKLEIFKRKLIFTGCKTYKVSIQLCLDRNHALCDYRCRICKMCQIHEIRCMCCDPKSKDCELIPKCNVQYCYKCLIKDDDSFSWQVKRMLLLGHNIKKQEGNGSLLSLLPLDILKEIFAFLEHLPKKFVDPICRKNRFFCSDVKCKEGYIYVEKTLNTDSQLIGLMDLKLSQKCGCCILESEKEIHRLLLERWEQERRDAYRPTKIQKKGFLNYAKNI